MTKLGLIHTVASLRPVFEGLAAEMLPGVEVTSLVDEDLLGETIAAGHIRPDTAERLEREVRDQFDEGSDLVLVTCSSVGPAVERIAAEHDWPLIRIDEAMGDRAIELGPRIGVAATLPTTLEPTEELIRRRARAAGEEVEVRSVIAEGAFDALKAGDLENHDRLVRDALETLAPTVNVVVLAQASMARVAASLPPELTERTPILASPRLAMERVARRLTGTAP